MARPSKAPGNMRSHQPDKTDPTADGNTARCQRCRQQELDRFSVSARFLIANKSCAGYGLNLQYCHTAVYYNNDWSWATRAQSEDRLHRLGQAHDVEIVDIYAEDTIDQRILACLERKENLAERFRSELKLRNGALWLHGRETEDNK